MTELVDTTITAKSGDPALIEAIDSIAHFQSPTPPDTSVDTVYAEDGNTVTVPVYNRQRTLDYRAAGDKVGVQLLVTPYVALESMELAVTLDVSTVSGYTPNGNPIIGTRTLQDYVRLVDGEPFVLGGLEREINTRDRGMVPVLGKIPVLGWLFGNE
ncbi:MAG: type II and III secretion system protein, partial [Candidatus Competibacteraceae bacterium]|nr:type II and III secretion system protein [Candidatus Competibacteraceae bacterium]